MRIPRNVIVVLLAALAGVASLVVIRVLREEPTDEQVIQLLLERAEKAAEDRQPSELMAVVSERFQGEGMGRRELSQFVTLQILRGSWSAVIPVATRITVAGDRAEAVVDAALVRGGEGKGLLSRLPQAGDTWRVHVSLERERDGWKVTGARWRRLLAHEG